MRKRKMSIQRRKKQAGAQNQRNLSLTSLRSPNHKAKQTRKRRRRRTLEWSTCLPGTKSIVRQMRAVDLPPQGLPPLWALRKRLLTSLQQLKVSSPRVIPWLLPRYPQAPASASHILTFLFLSNRCLNSTMTPFFLPTR